MTRRQAHSVGWITIAVITALLFLVDHFRMVNFQFNIFIAILLMASAVVVGIVVFVTRRVGIDSQRVDGLDTPSDLKPTEIGEIKN